MKSMFITAINFMYSYTDCSTDFCSSFWQSYRKTNTEIYGPKQEVYVISFPSVNRIELELNRIMILVLLPHYIAWLVITRINANLFQCHKFPHPHHRSSGMNINVWAKIFGYAILRTRKNTKLCIDRLLNWFEICQKPVIILMK